MNSFQRHVAKTMDSVLQNRSLTAAWARERLGMQAYAQGWNDQQRNPKVYANPFLGDAMEHYETGWSDSAFRSTNPLALVVQKIINTTRESYI